MPLPTPNKGEKQNDYMGRCMQFMTTENKAKPDGQKREQKQMVAICFSQWKKMHGGGNPSMMQGGK